MATMRRSWLCAIRARDVLVRTRTLLVNTATPYLPFPDLSPSSTFTSFAGDSFYNSMQLTYEHRFAHGLQLLGNFTCSKCATLTNFGIQGDYSPCDFDIPKVLHVSGTYDLPVGKGRQFLNHMNSFENAVIGGWSINGILTLENGQPGTIGCASSTSSNFGCNANVVSGQSLYGVSTTTDPVSIDWISRSSRTSQFRNGFMSSSVPNSST